MSNHASDIFNRQTIFVNIKHAVHVQCTVQFSSQMLYRIIYYTHDVIVIQFYIKNQSFKISPQQHYPPPHTKNLLYRALSMLMPTAFAPLIKLKYSLRQQYTKKNKDKKKICTYISFINSFILEQLILDSLIIKPI